MDVINVMIHVLQLAAVDITHGVTGLAGAEQRITVVQQLVSQKPDIYIVNKKKTRCHASGLFLYMDFSDQYDRQIRFHLNDLTHVESKLLSLHEP